METDKDCINCEDGQLDDDSLALVWGGSKRVAKWIGKEIGRALISEAISAGVQGVLDNLPKPPQPSSSFNGQVSGGGYGDGGSGSW